MANVAANSIAVAYNGQYASKMLLQPMFTSDEIMQHYTVYPNVKYKQNVFLANALRNITALNNGCADPTCTPDTFDIDDKVITTANVAVKLEQCWKEFYDEFIVESYKSGINMPDLTGTQLANVMLDRVRNGIKSDVVRNMWGGDTGSVNCNYNWTDGLFQLMNAGGVSVGTGTTGAVPGSALYTTVSSILPAGDGETLLDAVWQGASADLQQIPAGEKRIFVTPNIYNNYYASLTQIATAGSVDYGHSEAQSGVNYPRLHFRGVEVVPMYEWDTIMTTHNPTIWDIGGTDYKQGAIYTAKSNLMLGSDVTAPENELKMFYDPISDKMYIRSYFTMGFQYGWNNLVSASTLV
jgi:hypothetical protein